MTLRSPDHDQAEATVTATGRMAYVDIMKVIVIVVVIAHHSGQAYGLGGEWPVNDPPTTAWLGPFFRVNAAFGMALMFFLAGYFVPRSYDRKGGQRFLSERWKRIGVPMVLFMLILHVPIAYLTEEADLSFGEFVRSLYDTGLKSPYFHLWFLGNLLVFSAGYVLLRRLTERRNGHQEREWSPPTHATVVWFVIALTAVTWIVRGEFSIGHWFPLVFVVASEPAHLPQYISLFAIGAMAYRGDWLRRVPTRMGLIWLGIGLAASAGVYALSLLAPERAGEILAEGGLNTRSLLYTAWETLIGAAMCLGLMVLGRTVFKRTNRLIAVMAGAAYAAYMLHLGIVILLQSALEGPDLPTNLKFVVVTAVGVALSFGVAHASGRLPGLRNVLGTAPAKQRAEEAKQEIGT
jgi:surface polysaccharide O-acyltransferase-like enzyme